MPWSKGESGNPKGRPRAGFSLAEMVHARKNKSRARKMLEQLWIMACEKHDNPMARLKAIELLVRIGWQAEMARGLKVGVESPADGPQRVVFELEDHRT